MVRYGLMNSARAELRAAYPTQTRYEEKRQQRLEIEGSRRVSRFKKF
jgi:hypothetical protein